MASFISYRYNVNDGFLEHLKPLPHPQALPLLLNTSSIPVLDHKNSV